MFQDYFYRGAKPLAVRKGRSKTIPLHLDHLGSIRFAGMAEDDTPLEYSAYGSLIEGDSSTSRLLFTGQERDLADTPETTGDLDSFHQRYYNMHLGRFLTMDPVRGDPANPLSWNAYSYALGNPLNLCDPTGMYEIACADSEACQGLRETFETARQANLQRGGGIAATSEAYGAPGEANGITVTFGEVEPGAAANVVADILPNADASAFQLTANVTINPSLSGVQLEAAVGHEGQHLVDAQAFAATFSMEGTGSWDLSRNLTVQQTETNAYRITHAILAASNTPMGFLGEGGRRVELGRLTGRRQIDRAIGRILAGELYATRLQNRQIPRWDYQP